MNWFNSLGNYKKRTITGVILLLLLALIYKLGSDAAFISVCLIAVGTLYEQLVMLKKIPKHKRYQYFLMFYVYWSVVICVIAASFNALYLSESITIFKDNKVFEGIFTVVMLTAGAADSGGYMGGKGLKRFFPYKLAPKVSSGKTWIGAIVGVIIGTIIYTISSSNLLEGFATPYLDTLMVEGFVFSIVTILGDLFASLFKRAAKVDDSGTLIPGHGGIIDRTDGSFVLFCVYFISMFIIPVIIL